MALVLANRVQEAATANTTVSFTLSGAVAGFQTFAVVGDTNTTYYSAADGSGNWEVGLGTYSTAGPTLTRTTIYASSNSGNAVTFSGAVTVFVTYPSGRSVNLDSSGNVSALGTVASGTWQGATVGVAYGGTGVTASSGANSVVLRDANSNITVNRISQGLQTITASAGTTTLTAASQFNQALVGTGDHTFKLPDATTLTDTTAFQFNNNATGTLVITDNANATVGTVASGGAANIALLDNATVSGTWNVHAYIPESVTWGTNALALGSTVISGGTWQGGTIHPAYGGTGLTTFAAANYALYSTSASALTAGTLPVAAGGTGLTSGTSGGVPYYSSSSTIASSGALASNAFVIGGGAGASPATTTTGTGVVTAVGNAVNTTGGLVTQSGTLAASALLLGGGASTAITSTTTGNGVVTALGVNTGTAGAFVVNGGALGTPLSGTVTNLTGTASININGTVGATTPTTGAFTSITSTSASGILTRAAATQDGVELIGRAGGTSSFKVTLTPTTLGASRTLTLPDTTGTVITSGDTGTVTSTMIADGTIVNADINASAAIAVSKLAASTISGVTLGNNLSTLTLNTSGTGLSGSTTYNGSATATFTVTSNATNANTGSTIVARDSSGNFSAGTITAALSGNASTATTLATGRTIGMTGDVTWTSASFNGSANVTGTATLANSGVSAATYTNATVTVDAKGRVTSASNGTSGGLTITDDTSTNATRYLTFTSATSGSISGANVSSTKLTYNPSTGALSSTTVAGSSDERLKTNWRSLQADFIEQLAAVKAGIYDRTDMDVPVTQVGVTAQTLRPVLPDAVLEDANGMLSVAYGNAALVSAIELAKRVVEQEAKINRLEALVAQLTDK